MTHHENDDPNINQAIKDSKEFIKKHPNVPIIDVDISKPKKLRNRCGKPIKCWDSIHRNCLRVKNHKFGCNPFSNSKPQVGK